MVQTQRSTLFMKGRRLEQCYILAIITHYLFSLPLRNVLSYAYNNIRLGFETETGVRPDRRSVAALRMPYLLSQ